MAVHPPHPSQIEGIVCETNTGKSPRMHAYYLFWEKKIFGRRRILHGNGWVWIRAGVEAGVGLGFGGIGLGLGFGSGLGFELGGQV